MGAEDSIKKHKRTKSTKKKEGDLEIVSSKRVQRESEREDLIANTEALNKADARKNSKTGKSEKPGKTEKKKQTVGDLIANTEEVLNKTVARKNSKTGKSKKSGKAKNMKRAVGDEVAPDNFVEHKEKDNHDEVYRMSSGDEDCSKGLKKWVTQYHQSRPGIKVLQQRIDDFIMAHEAEEEKARGEREAQAAEGGWTVVVHHKGRKKTTDAESGVAVGSVAQAAVVEKAAKKKTKDVGIDFYRFQKREAHRNEIMMLQNKFEQDKKRIQQLRAARKFRPY